MNKLKICAGILLLVQCVLLGLCIWLIITNQATSTTYVSIVINVAFGVLDIYTITV